MRNLTEPGRCPTTQTVIVPQPCNAPTWRGLCESHTIVVGQTHSWCGGCGRKVEYREL